jgi:hypothetical protein
VTRLAEVHDLEAEAWDLMARIASANPTDDVGVIQEFAAVARLRELAQQLGWERDLLVELRELYAIRADEVRTIINKEVA